MLCSSKMRLILTICVWSALTAEWYTVLASGVFEINFDEFVNEAGRTEDGTCCDGSVGRSEICSKPCRTAFHVCFTHFQSKLTDSSPCTFGSVKTPVLGLNTFGTNYPREDPVKLEFTFTWPGTFSLVIEATHEDRGGNPHAVRRIAKIMKQGSVDANQEWKTETLVQNDKILRFSYRVRCDMHYYGKGCSEYCRPRDDMFGHYTCDMNGEKVCLSGWRSVNGSYCTEPICLSGCNTTHGYCRNPNECICRQGWKGKLCDQCKLYPGCKHGTCTEKFDCECEPGWGGLLCNLDLNYCVHHKPCKNGGRCTNYGQGSFTCDCPPGFAGRRCETPVNECEPNPCKNGAKCTNQAIGYTCECPDLFYGPNCERTLINCQSNPCRNGGVCVDSDERYTCACLRGFYGVNCEKVKRCSPSPCRNGGLCKETDAGFLCECAEGYSGKQCELHHSDKCYQHACKNGAECVPSAVGYECNCKNGFHGGHCELSARRCDEETCKNGGSCVNGPDSYICKCRIGFIGKNCEKEMCGGAVCANGGICDAQSKSFCQCKTGFAGKFCEKRGGPVPLQGAPAESLSYGGDDSNTRIIVLTKTENGGLSTAQSIAVCFASGFVLLLFVAIAICVAYHRQGKLGYTGGRRQKTLPASENAVTRDRRESSDTRTNPVKAIAAPIYPHRNSYVPEEPAIPSSGATLVPSGALVAKRSEGPCDVADVMEAKRSSVVLCNVPLQGRSKRWSSECDHKGSRYSYGCDAKDVRRQGESTSFLPCAGMHQAAPQRQMDHMRLPTYQEACKDAGFSGSDVV